MPLVCPCPSSSIRCACTDADKCAIKYELINLSLPHSSEGLASFIPNNSFG